MDQVTLKNRSGERRMDIPGKGAVLKNIRTINDSLKKIDDEIKMHSSRIHEIIKKEKENSPRNVILSQLQEIRGELKIFKDERSKLHNENDSNKAKMEELKSLSEHGGSCFMSEEQINARMEELNMKLIRESLSTTEERQIANDLSALKVKKDKLGDVKENMKLLKNLDVRSKELRAQIAKLSKEIATRAEKSNELKSELDAINESSKKKHPEVDTLNEKIKFLKDEKTKLYTLREEKRGELHAMEVEYKKMEKDILLARENEDGKKMKKEEIAELRKSIDGLNKKISEFDVKVFDRLLVELNKLKKEKSYNLNLDLVSGLLRNGIPFPKNEKTMDEAIAVVLKTRENADVHFAERTTGFVAEINVIKTQIEAKQAELDAMPETNMELLKKGGYFAKKHKEEE